MNDSAGQTIPNAVLAKLGSGGAVCVYSASDLAILQRDFGTSQSRSDLNGDGIVDAADLSILASNWTSAQTTC